MAFPEVTNNPIEIIECFMDLIFIMDIAIQFFIPFYNNEEELIKSKYLIALNYLSGWFVIDLIASIPGSIITFFLLGINPQEEMTSYAKINSTSFQKINKLTRLAKFYRVLKITKLSKVLKMSGDSNKKKRSNKLLVKDDIGLSSSVKRILNFSFVFVFASHMISCIWIFIGTLDYPNWLVKANISDSSNFAIYISSLYFHWTTIFTIGYGDILSANTTERFYNIFLMFVGVLIYSFAVSALGTILSNDDDKSTERFLKNVDMLYEMRLSYNIPALFYEKIEKFLRYDFENNKVEKFGFINDLPIRIKNELLLNMYKDVIKNFKFFKGKSIEFSTRVVYMMKQLRFTKNEDLVLENEFMEEIIFVRSGHLTVNLGLKYNKLKIMEIQPNEHFGDILILLNLPSPVGLNVASKCADLIIIRKDDVIELSKFYPDCIQKIFLISEYNYNSMMSRIEKKKQKFESEKEKILKKQLLFNEYLGFVKKKRKNIVFTTDSNNNKNNSNQNFQRLNKNNIDDSSNIIRIKRFQTAEISLPYKKNISKLYENNQPCNINKNIKNNKAEIDSYNLTVGKIENSVSNVGYLDQKNYSCCNNIISRNSAGNISLPFQHKSPEKTNSNINFNNTHSSRSDKYIQPANIDSKRTLVKLNTLSESKKDFNLKKNNSSFYNSDQLFTQNENFESSLLFDTKNDIIESFSVARNNYIINKQKAKEDEIEHTSKKLENTFLSSRILSSKSKNNMLKKQSSLQLSNANSTLKIPNYNRIINFNCIKNTVKEYENNKTELIDCEKTRNEKNENLFNEKRNTDKKHLNNSNNSNNASNNSRGNSSRCQKRNSNKIQNDEYDFSYNNINPNEQSIIIGINESKHNYSRKNSELVILNDDFGNYGIEKINDNNNIKIKNINNKTNKNTNEATTVDNNCIFKSTDVNRKKISEIHNIQKVNVVNKLKNSEEFNSNSNSNYSHNYNLDLENEAIYTINKINFTNLINNIPQKNYTSGRNSRNSNNNSHYNNYNNNLYNNNINLNLLTLASENSKIFTNTSQKSDPEMDYNNNNHPNTNLIRNNSFNSFNFLEKLKKNNQVKKETIIKPEDNRNSINNANRIINSSPNNIIYIDNLNINNNCKNIYETGAKKWGDPYCNSKDSSSRKNYSRNEIKNKNVNNLLTFKSRLNKYKEDEINQKSVKEENKINFKKNQKNNFLLNPNNNIDYNKKDNESLSKSNHNSGSNSKNNSYYNCSSNKEKSEDSKIINKEFSIDLEVCKRNSSFDKISVDSSPKNSLKENKNMNKKKKKNFKNKNMQIISKLSTKIPSGNYLNNKEPESISNAKGESGSTYKKLWKNANKHFTYLNQNQLNDSSECESKKSINKKLVRYRCKSLSSVTNNSIQPLNKYTKIGLIDKKNIRILKKINYREKQFLQRNDLNIDLPKEHKKIFSKTITVNFSGKDAFKTSKDNIKKKVNEYRLSNGKKENKNNEIIEKEEDYFCTNFDSGKKTEQYEFNLSKKEKINESFDYDYDIFTDLYPNESKTDRKKESYLKTVNVEMKSLNENKIKRENSDSSKITKIVEETDKDKYSVNKNASKAKGGDLESLIIESENSYDASSKNYNKKGKTIEFGRRISNNNNLQREYLSNFNTSNSDLKRFLLLGIQQEYKLEAEKINKIIIKIIENRNQKDSFTLDKNNKKILKFKKFFVFNENINNDVKKTPNQERNLDSISIPFVEI